MQDAIPNLPELNPEDLAELRTLGQIVEYMQSKAGASAAPVVAGAAPQSVASSASAASVAVVDEGVFSNTLMQVVAEKTGYPVEMLELEMDMEADLGIDSIKRVEILGATQDAIPGLPEIEPETLAEMRTLGEIVKAFSSVRGTAAVSTLSSFEPAPSAVVEVSRLPSPSLIEQRVDGAKCLLVDDGSAASTKLADKLGKQGWQVVALRPAWVKVTAKKGFAKGAELLELAALNEDKLKLLLDSCGALDAVIYLQPKLAINGIEYPEESKQSLMLAFLLAKLCNVKAATKARASFMVLTRQGGQLGYNDEAEADLVQAGLNGLVKTLAQEWPEVFCRAIDVDAKTTVDKLADIVSTELLDANTALHEVAYSKDGRTTLIGVETDSYTLAGGKRISKDSVFLVSGGAKGVTAHCVIRLAREYGSKFILLGRSAYEPAAEPAWAQGIDDDVVLKKAAMQQLQAQGDKPTPVKVQQLLKPIYSLREIQQTLNAIEAAGGKAEYVSVDVTDAKAVQAAVAPAVKNLGKVTGIIHGAGVLADKFIEQKTLEDFNAVYRTKIDGLTAMLSCVDENSLQHLVLFSSAAGFYGNPGQSDYAIANEILNKTALRFKTLHPEAQVLSFNWGPWDGGMVTPELKRMFTERGVYIIPLDAGAELMLREMDAADNRSPQILVGNEMSGAAAEEETPVKKPQASRLSKVVQAANNPFLADHVIGGNPVLPTVCAMAWMTEAAESLYPGFHCSQLEDYKLLKGIVFDGSEPAAVTIEFASNAQTASDLLLACKVSSMNASGKPVYHYMANLKLTRKQQSVLPVWAGQLPAEPVKTADVFYRNGTLFHGESLQGLTQLLACDENGLILACRVPEMAVSRQGEFPLQQSNIFANDLVYQAMLVWVREQMGQGSLPAATASWCAYRQLQAGEDFYLVLTIKQSASNKMVADIAVVDSQQHLVADIHGAEVTISETLNKLFKPAAA